jgi:hypothetical protein
MLLKHVPLESPVILRLEWCKHAEADFAAQAPQGFDPNQQQFDQNGQPIDPNQQQFDQNGQPIDPNQPQFDQNGQPIDPNQQDFAQDDFDQQDFAQAPEFIQEETDDFNADYGPSPADAPVEVSMEEPAEAPMPEEEEMAPEEAPAPEVAKTQTTTAPASLKTAGYTAVAGKDYIPAGAGEAPNAVTVAVRPSFILQSSRRAASCMFQHSCCTLRHVIFAVLIDSRRCGIRRAAMEASHSRSQKAAVFH